MDGTIWWHKGRKETNFPQDWTIFYWSWWLVYAPFIDYLSHVSQKDVHLKKLY